MWVSACNSLLHTNWKDPKCLPTSEWINEIWKVQMTEYQWAMRSEYWLIVSKGGTIPWVRGHELSKSRGKDLGTSKQAIMHPPIAPCSWGWMWYDRPTVWSSYLEFSTVKDCNLKLQVETKLHFVRVVHHSNRKETKIVRYNKTFSWGNKQEPQIHHAQGINTRRLGANTKRHMASPRDTIQLIPKSKPAGQSLEALRKTTAIPVERYPQTAHPSISLQSWNIS